MDESTVFKAFELLNHRDYLRIFIARVPAHDFEALVHSRKPEPIRLELSADDTASIRGRLLAIAQSQLKTVEERLAAMGVVVDYDPCAGRRGS